MTCLRRALLILLAAVLFMSATLARADHLPVIVPDFAEDPSCPQFTIGPVPLEDENSFNLLEPPLLSYGETSTDPAGMETQDTLMMSWQQEVPDVEAQAGWELVFGEDPDLTGGQIVLSINPPGGVDADGVFHGILSVSIVAVDIGGKVAGGWGFNTNQTTLPMPPATSLANNWMQNVTINIGTGPAAGSATVTGGPAGPMTGPDFLIPGNGNFANIGSLQFFENGILQAGVAVIPGQTILGLFNYWDHITITAPPRITCMPTPTTLWPPNHKMVAVQVSVQTVNAPPGAMLQVTAGSDEPDNGPADGNTTGDVDGQDGSTSPVDVSANFTFDPTVNAWVGTVNLRAERAGTGDGRTYTIDAALVDAAGNVVAQDSCTVEVPHDRGKKK